MKEIRYFYVPNAADQMELPPDEATHATRVLRLREGDELFLMDGKGTFYRAGVTLATLKKCLYEIKETMPQEKSWHGRIHLAIAPTKMIDRMEWMVEKATEVGFDEITFLDCRFSERRTLRIDRIEKIVVAAMKQSRKPWIPVVSPMMPFADFVKMPCEGKKYIAHCYGEIERGDLFSDLLNDKGNHDVTVMVGPEGDFSIDEVRLAISEGYQSISLGNSRLRTETAGLTSVMMAQLALRRM
ncbi:MAG: 16S rRNA (uracil(1498)-N(3))-methyltransferase [Prevotella sp.]|nr:16S rRNA (uracil(1498)-N(3))-methyltransferase [Prevotella sp.]